MLTDITGFATQVVAGQISLQKPALLLWSIPAFILLFYLIKKQFVDIREDAATSIRRRKARTWMIVTRCIIALLLIICFTTPVRIEERTINSPPFVKILFDNSSSMSIYDTSGYSILEKALADKITVTTASIAGGERSPLGDNILSRIKKGDNVLLVTDGQTTSGTAIGDLSLFAAANNITLSLLRMPIAKHDAWVTINGPDKVAAGTESTFTVDVGTTGTDNVKLTVTIDGETVLDTSTGPATHPIKKSLAEGTHKIVATIDTKDTIGMNNIFYKSVKAVPRPKVYFWSQRDNPPLAELYTQTYDVQSGSTLPSDLSPYYAIILNDLPSSAIPVDSAAHINRFITDGGGLLAIGGQNSYDRGGYATHPIKNSLPVFVGSPGKDVGDVNVVVLIDASQSAGAGEGAGVTISKSITLALINDMDPKVRIGVVAFRDQGQIVSPLIAKEQTNALQDNVKRIFGTGRSNMADGIKVSLEMLATAQGNKNLVIISDGLLLDQVAEQTRSYVQAALTAGVKVYTIGAAVGDEAFIRERVNEEFMQELAAISHGIYFRADEASRLKLIFNPPKDAPKRNETDRQATVIDSNHFITKDLLFKDALLTGYNSVLPKGSARLLASMNSGEPLLVVWRLGLGRVATLATDDGTGWAGPLVNKDNSPILLRTLNWAIGDPDRKNKVRVEMTPGTLGEPMDITVYSDTPSVSRDTTFVRTGENSYSGSFTPSQLGFVDVAGATAGVNAPLEFKALGESKALTRAITNTDGRFFDTTAVEQIAELARTKSKTVVREETPVRWPLAFLIFIIWIAELIIRRIYGKS